MSAIRDSFFYHRGRGVPALRAFELAQADQAAGKARFPTYPRRLAFGWGNARSDNGAVWVESLPAAGLRLVGWADEIADLRHTGWYTEDDGDGDIYRGAVVQLPARDGCPLYLAAYADPNNRGAYRVDMSAIIRGEHGGEDDRSKRDAARAADSFAESEAESERDYNRAWRAGRRYEDAAEEIKSIRADVLATISEVKAACKARRDIYGAKVRGLIRDRIESALEEIRKLRKERADLLDSFGREPGFIE